MKTFYMTEIRLRGFEAVADDSLTGTSIGDQTDLVAEWTVGISCCIATRLKVMSASDYKAT